MAKKKTAPAGAPEQIEAGVLTKAQERAIAREAKAKEKADQKAADKQEKALQREAKAKEKADQKAAEKAVKAEQKAADKALKAEQKAAEKAEKKAEKAAEKVRLKEEAAVQRKENIAQRKALIEARQLAVKAAEGRRAKTTHVEVHFERGLSKPQLFSTRHQVLDVVKRLAENGPLISIDAIQAECNSFLYGESVRSYLSKLEGMDHLTMVRVE